MNKPKQMKWLIYLLACLGVISPVYAADVYFKLTDFVGDSAKSRKVVLKPLSLPVGDTNGIYSLDWKTYTTSTTGDFWVSNMYAGLYTIELQAPPTLTKFTVGIPSTSVTVLASQCITSPTNTAWPPGGYAWSISASDARYLSVNSPATNVLTSIAGDGIDVELNGLQYTISTAVPFQPQSANLDGWSLISTNELGAAGSIGNGSSATNLYLYGTTIMDWILGDGSQLTNISVTGIAATGISATKYLKGDGTWDTPADGGGIAFTNDVDANGYALTNLSGIEIVGPGASTIGTNTYFVGITNQYLKAGSNGLVVGADAAGGTGVTNHQSNVEFGTPFSVTNGSGEILIGGVGLGNDQLQLSGALPPYFPMGLISAEAEFLSSVKVAGVLTATNGIKIGANSLQITNDASGSLFTESGNSVLRFATNSVTAPVKFLFSTNGIKIGAVAITNVGSVIHMAGSLNIGAGDLTANTVVATSFEGAGYDITSLDAGQLTSGTFAPARLATSPAQNQIPVVASGATAFEWAYVTNKLPAVLTNGVSGPVSGAASNATGGTVTNGLASQAYAQGLTNGYMKAAAVGAQIGSSNFLTSASSGAPLNGTNDWTGTNDFRDKVLFSATKGITIGSTVITNSASTLYISGQVNMANADLVAASFVGDGGDLTGLGNAATVTTITSAQVTNALPASLTNAVTGPASNATGGTVTNGLASTNYVVNATNVLWAPARLAAGTEAGKIPRVASGALTWEWVDMTPATTWATMQALANDKILTNNHAADITFAGSVTAPKLTNVIAANLFTNTATASPGTNTVTMWLPVTIGGTNYYIPLCK